MENIAVLAIPAVLAIVLVRCLFVPMRWIFKLSTHTACGLVCLGLLNTVSGFTGLYLPINAVTVLMAGVLGVPGIGMIALLEMI